MNDENSSNEQNGLSTEQVELAALPHTVETAFQSQPIPEIMTRSRLQTDDRTHNSQMLPEVPDAAPLVDSSPSNVCDWCLGPCCFCFYWYDKQDDSYRWCCFDADNS